MMIRRPQPVRRRPRGDGTVTDSKPALVVCVVLAGLFLGVNNTLITETVMISAPVERSTASAAYSFVRFVGAQRLRTSPASSASTTCTCRSGWRRMHRPGILVLATGRKVLAHVDDHDPEPHSVEEAVAVTVGDAD